MDLTQDQIDALKAQCTEVAAVTEADLRYLRLTALRLPSGCVPPHADALLCLDARDGYPTRLFLSCRVVGRSATTLNWNASVPIVGSTWHAYSWKVPDPLLSPDQILTEHLKALL